MAGDARRARGPPHARAHGDLVRTGLYGRTTACGQRLTPALPGVAHRTVPCGTSLVLHRAGRFVTARVVDRGPLTGGVTLDLTAATARSLGLQAAEPIHSSR